MKAELGLSNFQWGLVGVAFQFAYASSSRRQDTGAIASARGAS